MRIWPFGKAEHRNVNFTDATTGAQLNFATGSGLPAVAEQLAAVETAAGLWQRAFASATVEPDIPALTPTILGSIGRQLAVQGEGVYALDVGIDGALVLRPCCSWEIHGGPDPDLWTYRVEMAGPSRTDKRVIPADRLIHPKYATRPAAPWRGVSPLGIASETRKLAGWIERRLTEESSTVSAYLLALPENRPDSTSLKADLKAGAGRLHIVDTTKGAYGAGNEQAPREDWESHRLGADPPAILGKLRQDVRQDVFSTYGIPNTIFGSGGAAREAYRQFLASTIQPLAKLVVEAIRGPLNTPDLTLTFEALRAADIASRARAYSVLVGADFDKTEAAEVTGLD